ncbi:MAG TPA: EAL domain-containing protein [Rhodospirillales bacterium]|nr:EAL domain-containing protein [Rhodospirillales bacterium]
MTVATSLASNPTPGASASSPLRAERDRFVALAFCWGDILLELDGDGRIVYAAGAIEPLLGLPTEELVGRTLESAVVPGERPAVRALLAGATGRKRIEAASLQLSGAAGASPPLMVAGYQLADLNGHFFLALRACPAPPKPGGFGRRSRDGALGLYDAAGFIDMVTSQLADGRFDGANRCLSLIMLQGYEALRHRLVESAEHELQARIAAALRAGAIDGASATCVGPDRYSLIHRADFDVSGLQGEISGFTRDLDPDAVGAEVEAATLELDREGLSSGDVAQGLTYAMSRFKALDPSAAGMADFSTTFSAVVQDAVAALADLQQLIEGGLFTVLLQPIHDARSGAVHACSAMVRLPAQNGRDVTGERLALAESAGVIVDLDLAVIRKIVDLLKTKVPVNAEPVVAVRISGQTVDALSALAQLDQLIRDNPWVRGRLIFEITQSSRIADAGAANAGIQRLRAQGIQVCLCDFATSAHGFQYLADLEVDSVKLAADAIEHARDARQGKAYIKALMAFCREFGVATIAGGVDDEATLRLVRGCGVQYVQGALFGLPSADPRTLGRAAPTHLFKDKAQW